MNNCTGTHLVAVGMRVKWQACHGGSTVHAPPNIHHVFQKCPTLLKLWMYL